MKILLRSLGFHTMKDPLQRLWKLTEGFNIMDINNDFFMVKFDTKADRTYVMEGGDDILLLLNSAMLDTGIRFSHDEY